MFTGIVQTLGKVRTLQPAPSGVRLVIDRQGWLPAGGHIAHGDSICVSGVCLTVVEHDRETLAFDVIAETLAKTTLGRLQVGSAVNLESSITANTPMGGHFVQGHVDGVGALRNVVASPQEWRLTIQPPADLLDYIVPKGSVAVDGVSLTVAAVGGDSFQVALIPTTLKLTTLGQARTGQSVNLETDIVSKTIVHWLRRQAESGSRLTLDKLQQAGFGG